MARVFVSGSSTGLGLLTGKELLASGHDVVFHARNAAGCGGPGDERRRRPRPLWWAISAPSVVRWTSPIKSMRMGLWMPSFTMQVSVMAGLSSEPPKGIRTSWPSTSLAPYILTALLRRPKRLVYLSSGMHRTEPHLDDILWQTRRWNGSLAYSESKLYVTALSFAIARYWPDVTANAVDPGWVPTRMGGPGAPDDLVEGCATQVALATSDDSRLSGLTGEYLHHMATQAPSKVSRDVDFQDRLLDVCRELTGIALGTDPRGQAGEAVRFP